MIHVRYPILNNEHEEMVFEFIMYYAVGINTTNDIEAMSKGGAIIRATLTFNNEIFTLGFYITTLLECN